VAFAELPVKIRLRERSELTAWLSLHAGKR
jgi:hypothetical protein